MWVDAGGAATLLVGWGANQTLWLSDVFTSVQQLGTWEGTPGPEAIPLTSEGRPTTARTSGSPRRRRDKNTILPRLHDVTADRRGGLSPSREPGGTILRRTPSPPDAAWPARFTADLPTEAELPGYARRCQPEFMSLSCAPSRIRTCAHGSGGGSRARP